MAGRMGRRISRKLLIVIVLAIVVTVISASSYQYLESTSKGGDVDDRLVARISVDEQIIRIETDINLSGEGSKGAIVTYEWFIGNESIGKGMVMNHTFDEGGWFEVNLTVSNKQGRNATSSIIIGVQREDGVYDWEGPRDRMLRPRWYSWSGVWVRTWPNIGEPTVDIKCDVRDAYGIIGFQVEVMSDERGTVLHSESATVTGSVSYTYTVQPTDFFENATRVFVKVIVEEGRHGGYHMVISVVYPFDDITVPTEVED